MVKEDWDAYVSKLSPEDQATAEILEDADDTEELTAITYFGTLVTGDKFYTAKYKGYDIFCDAEARPLALNWSAMSMADLDEALDCNTDLLLSEQEVSESLYDWLVHYRTKALSDLVSEAYRLSGATCEIDETALENLIGQMHWNEYHIYNKYLLVKDCNICRLGDPAVSPSVNLDRYDEAVEIIRQDAQRLYGSTFPVEAIVKGGELATELESRGILKKV